MLAGLILLGRFALELNHQQSATQAQDRAWHDLVEAAAGPATSPSGSPVPDVTPSPTDVLPGGIYLKLTIDKLSETGVAINSDWTGLKISSMVHYRDSPPPGGHGNVLLAFHREPHWLNINQLAAGDVFHVETVDRTVYTYQVDFAKVVSATDVSLLRPTDGMDLTLITCDPPFRDYNRLYFRAHLVVPPASPPAAASPSP